jgi:hypothetical protein
MEQQARKTDRIVGTLEAAELLDIGRSTLNRRWRVMGLTFLRLPCGPPALSGDSSRNEPHRA